MRVPDLAKLEKISFVRRALGKCMYKECKQRGAQRFRRTYIMHTGALAAETRALPRKYAGVEEFLHADRFYAAT